MATFYVGASGNDGDKIASGSWSYTGAEITIGNFSGDTYKAALRFESVNIPKNSTINSATLKGYNSSVSGQSGGEIVRVKIYGIDEDNTATMTSDPLSRTKTTAAVDWDFEPSASDASYTSPSITTIIAEITSRAGWSSGNALGFIIEDDSSDSVRENFYSYDGDATKDFELTVTWTAPASTSSSTSTSTSTSSTSTSTSTSSSTTTQTPLASLVTGIVRVTKEGKDVLSSNLLDDFFLDSNYPLLKVYDYGSFTTLNNGTKTITHDLGYIPYAMVFSQYILDDGDGGVTLTDEYYQHDWYLWGATYYSTGYTKIYNDKIDIVCENINMTTIDGGIDGFYYIFTEEVT